MIHSAPLFFWAIFFFLGSCMAIHPHVSYCIPFLLLLLFSKRKIQACILFSAGLVFAYLQCSIPCEETRVGKGIFILDSIAPTQSPFDSSYALKGKLKIFESEGVSTFNLPCVIFQKKIPETGSKWILEGKLKDRNFKPQKDRPLDPLRKLFLSCKMAV